MKSATALLALIALALTSPAEARDSRVRLVGYETDAVVTVHGQRGIQTMIQFASDERIENIAVGDSAVWQITPGKSGDAIFVKPLVPSGTTNMTVVTNRRHYLFELRAGSRSGTAAYLLRFAYPQPVQLAVESDSPAIEPAPAAEAEPPRPELPDPVLRRRDWVIKGDASLRPEAVFDDGLATYIAWPESRELPAVLARGGDGVEGAANYVLRDGHLVIDGVEPSYTIQLGKARIVLTKSGKPAETSKGAGK